jgi:hypothetical protein
MLRPTEEELKQARELDIDPTGMNGPQLREAIRKATRAGTASIQNSEEYRNLADIASMFDINTQPSDSIQKIVDRIEAKLTEIFENKGIQPGVTIRFSSAHRMYGNEPLHVKSTSFFWTNQQPRIHATRPGTDIASVNACSVALYATVVTE